MQPELLSLARLTIGEVQRFPEIGRAYQTAGHDKVLQGLMGLLTTHRDAGRLEFEDAELAAQDLWGLILSAPRTQGFTFQTKSPAAPNSSAMSKTDCACFCVPIPPTPPPIF